MPTKQTIAEPPVKHTPHGLGTLTVDADFRKDADLGQYLGRLDILDTKGQRVGSVTLRPHRTDAQHLAVAHLFAGAPDLLEAAAFALSVLRANGLFETSERLAEEKLVVAIAKAYGAK